MKKVVLLLMLVLFSIIVYAQDTGITPDSRLYGLDKAIDRLKLLLTFTQEDKAKIGLNIAHERLLEVKEMINKKDLESAEKAKINYHNTLTNVKSNIKSIKSANSLTEIEKEIEVENELEELELEKDNIKISIKGQLTPEQEKQILDLINQLDLKFDEIKIELKNKKDSTKLKIKLTTNKSDDEIEREIEEIEIEKNLTTIKLVKAQEKIEDATEEINKLNEELRKTNISDPSINSLLREAISHLDNANAAFRNNNYGEAYGQANSALQLAENALKQIEKESEIEEEEEETEDEDLDDEED